MVERGLGCVGAEGVGLGVGSRDGRVSSHGAVCFRSWDCSAAVLSAACRSHPRVNGFACSAFSLASRATSMIRCTSLTSRGGSVFHHSVRSASSRLASSSSSTGSGSGRRGSRPISRGTGSGLDSKLLPDVLLGGGVGASTSCRPRDAMGWRSNTVIPGTGSSPCRVPSCLLLELSEQAGRVAHLFADGRQVPVGRGDAPVDRIEDAVPTSFGESRGWRGPRGWWGYVRCPAPQAAVVDAHASGSMRLHCLAQSARSRSRNSVESKGLFDTSTRFQTLRFLAPVFCSPGGGVYDRYPLAVLVI